MFCPVEAVEGMARLITASEAMERIDYDFELVGLSAHEPVSVGKNLEVEAFAVDHRIPGLGFHLWQTRLRLRDRYAGASRHELVDLKRRGVPIEMESRRLWLSYCGDTGPGVLDREERLFDASILMLECTFLDAAHSARAAEYRHMHIDDLARRRERFRNDELILHHWSNRYSCSTIRSLVLRALDGVPPRVHLFGCGANRDGEIA